MDPDQQEVAEVSVAEVAAEGPSDALVQELRSKLASAEETSWQLTLKLREVLGSVDQLNEDVACLEAENRNKETRIEQLMRDNALLAAEVKTLQPSGSLGGKKSSSRASVSQIQDLPQSRDRSNSVRARSNSVRSTKSEAPVGTLKLPVQRTKAPSRVVTKVASKVVPDVKLNVKKKIAL